MTTNLHPSQALPGHRLRPLVAPRSVALVGASARPGSLSSSATRACSSSGFEGDLYLVNPNYPEIEGRRCYPSLSSLPEPAEHVMLCVSNARLEAAFNDALETGARAVTVFSSAYLDNDADPPLVARLQARARNAGVLVCGANTAGFHHRSHRLRCSLGHFGIEPAGNVGLISHSGSAYSAIMDTHGRVAWDLTVCTGNEFSVTTADYLDYMTEMPSTRAIGLFIETVRDPQGFLAALEKAAARDIPIVVLKLARSETGARFAVSHSGALAGNDAIYDAVFDHYGVLRVDDLDELIASLQLLSTDRRPGPGGLAAIADSGGERELVADHADQVGVRFSEISIATRAALSLVLEPGLEADNPLDAWGTGNNIDHIFGGCLELLINDPDTGMGLWIADLHDGSYYHDLFAEIATGLRTRVDKPLAFITCYSRGDNNTLAASLGATGIPVLEGVRQGLIAVRNAFSYRDFQARAPMSPPLIDEVVIKRWRERLTVDEPLDEFTGLALLADFGIPVASSELVTDEPAALAAAQRIGFPVALKTAVPGVTHKSDQDGVILTLRDSAEAAVAYQRLATNLGPQVLISSMVDPGVEMTLGMVQDPQFGPVVIVGSGGVLIEVLRDVLFALPPFDTVRARTMINRLQGRALLDGVRGAPRADIDGLCEVLARFSVLAASLGDLIQEFDVNPVIVTPRGATAVDALVVPMGQG